MEVPNQQAEVESDVLPNAYLFYPNPRMFTSMRQWEERAANATEFIPGRREHHLRETAPTDHLPEVIGYAPITLLIPILRCEPSPAALEYYNTSQDGQNCCPAGFYVPALLPPHHTPTHDMQDYEGYVPEMNNQAMQNQAIHMQQYHHQNYEYHDYVDHDHIQEFQMQVLRAQEIRAQEIRAQEIRAQEIRAQEIRAQEIRAQEIRDQEICAQESRAQESRAQESRAQESRAQESRAQEIRAQESRAQENKNQENKDQENKDQENKDQELQNQEIRMVAQEEEVQDALSQETPSEPTSSSADEIEALFVGTLPLALPELGDMTRTEYSQSKTEFRSVVLDHQKMAFATFENKVGPSESDEFQSVPKHMSFDQSNLSSKAKEAMQSAINESMRSKAAVKEQRRMLGKTAPSAIGKAESVSVMMKPQSGHDVSEQVQSGKSSDEPCSSSSLYPVPRSGETTQKTEHSSTPKTSKKKNKEKKKVRNEKDDDEKLFEEAAIHNMTIQLETYCEVRKEIRRTQFIAPKSDDDSPFEVFENRLMKNARDMHGDPDVKLKDEFCRQVLSDLPTMEMDEPADRQDLIRLFHLLAKRNDEILVIDCVFLKAAMVDPDENPADLLLFYLWSSVKHSMGQKEVDECRKEEVITSEAVESSASESANERIAVDTTKKPNDMSAHVDRYLEFRQDAHRTGLPLDDDKQYEDFTTFVKSLFQATLGASEALTEKDVLRKNTVCNIVLRRLGDWSFPDDVREVLNQFYTFLVTRDDEILLRDFSVLHKLLKQSNPSVYFEYYYQLFLHSLEQD